MRLFLQSASLMLALVAVAVPLRAQDHDGDEDDGRMQECRRDDFGWRHRDRYRHCEIRETGIANPRGKLIVDTGRNGGVAVRAWDRDSIAIVAKIRTQAGSEAQATRMAERIRIVTSGGTTRAEGPDQDGHDEFWFVSFEISAPRKTDLELDTDNGPLSVRGMSGTMQLSADNGPVALYGVSGDVRARVRNGPLSVTLSGDRWEGAGLDAETVNGPVVLAIPDNYSAKLETGTVNGPLSVDFPLTVTFQGRWRQQLNATLGSGGAPVRVVTTNGPLVIRRRGRI